MNGVHCVPKIGIGLLLLLLLEFGLLKHFLMKWECWTYLNLSLFVRAVEVMGGFFNPYVAIIMEHLFCILIGTELKVKVIIFCVFDLSVFFFSISSFCVCVFFFCKL